MQNGHRISLDTFKFFLALEDFDVFNVFMSARNKELDEEVLARIRGVNY